MKRALFLFLLSLLFGTAIAQPNFQASFGGTASDNANSITRALDGGYVLAGVTSSFANPNGNFMVVKTDVNGNRIWSREYGGTGAEYLRSIRATSDGGYVLAGHTASYTVGAEDAIFIKLNGTGGIQWAVTFGGVGVERGCDIKETPWGDFAFCGSTRSFGPGSANNDFIGRLNANGTLNWCRVIGTASEESVFGLTIAPDGDFWATGPTNSPGSSSNFDVHVIRVDSAGNFGFYRQFQSPADEHSRTIEPTADGGFILNAHTNAGSATGWDWMLLKLDSLGNYEWARDYRGGAADLAMSVISTQAGGYAFSGYTGSGSLGNFDLGLVVTDNMGIPIWEKVMGGSADDDPAWGGKNIIEVSPGQFALASGTLSFGAGSDDFYQVVVDSTTAGSPCNEGTLILSNPGRTHTTANVAVSVVNSTAFVNRMVADIGVTPVDSMLCRVQDSLSGIINTYTPVTSVDSCNGVSVVSSAGFSVGDRVLLIQMQGADMNLTNTAAFGTVTNLNDAGNYEFAEIASITGTSVSFVNALLRNYDATAGFQMISVPQYTNPIVTGTLTAAPWNGSSGGVLVFEATGEVSMAANMDVAGLGFRGGAPSQNGYSGCSTTDYFMAQPNGFGAEKGEGIANPGPAFGAGQGTRANGGGGGNHVNSGGAGGGNAGAGGEGGNQWGGCPVIAIGGDGGRALTYSNVLNKVFLGGGAGGGHQNNTCSTPGEAGGGIVIISADSIAGNGFSILANGNDQTAIGCIDGAGGGGGGGAILLDVPIVNSPLTTDVSGGDGGDISAANHGPGGGGGGGILWMSGAIPGTVTPVLNGGTNGLASGAAHGALPGSAGITLTGLNLPESTSPVILAPFSLGNDTTLCEGDSLQLAPGVSGGSYLWSTGETSQTIVVDTTGTYWMELSPGTACAQRDTIVVNFLAPPQPNLGNDTVLCAGDSITLDPNSPGPNSYLWSTGATSNTIQAAAAGQFWVEVTESTGLCSGRDTLQLNLPVPLIVDIGPDTSICQNDTLILNAGNPGNTYLWSTGATAPTLGVFAAGTYSVTVTNALGCPYADTMVLAINPLPVVSLGPDTAFCTGNSVTLNPGGPWSGILWSTGAVTPTLTVSSAGLYWVEVTDGNSCSNRDSIQVSADTLPVVNLGPDTVICAGTSINLDAGIPGQIYNWSTSATTQSISVNATGLYAVTVTDGNGCDGSDDRQVTVAPNPVVNLGNDTLICQGASVTLSAGPAGNTYLWSNAATTPSITVSTAGNYAVTVTSPAGCQGTDDINITIAPLPTVNLGPDQAICAGSSVSLNAGNPGGTYVWSTGALIQQIIVSNAGNYAVTVTDGNGCQGMDDVNISVNPLPVVNLGPDQEACDGATVILDAGNAGASYQWAGGSTNQMISVTTTGTYSVTVTDVNGCVNSDAIVVTFRANPVANLGADLRICAGTSVNLNANGGNTNPGASYLWSTGQTGANIQVNTTGWVWVVITSGPGCTDRDSVWVETIPLPIVDLGPDQILCEGDSLQLDAGNPGQAYLWSNGETSQTVFISFGGSYDVIVSTPEGCTGQDAIQIEERNQFAIDLGQDTTICGNGPLSLDALTPFGNYIWSSGETTPEIDAYFSGLFWVEVDNSCFTERDSIQIEFLGSNGPFAPNAFTPNGDGLNDEFGFLGLNIEEYTLLIFDRWGNLVFETMDPSATWDGKIDGNDAPEGVYAYRVQFRNCKGVPTDRGGSITLYR